MDILVILAFNSALLREICEKESSAVHYLGEERAMKLKRRLADLEAALTIQDVMVGSPKMSGRDCEIALTSDSKLYLRQNYPQDYKENGPKNWTEVGRVKIMGVANVK